MRVGRLTKAHGLKGGLKIELYTDEPARRFQTGASFALQVPTSSKWHGKRLELREFRVLNSNPVGFFVGIDDRTEAESLVKAVLWVEQDATELPPEPDAWYQHQLAGLAVIRDGEQIGRVARIEPMPAQDLLVVAVGETEVLLPFVRAFVPEVDLPGGQIVITPPGGLFEELDDASENEVSRSEQPAEAADSGVSERSEQPSVSVDRGGRERSEQPSRDHTEAVDPS